MNLFSLVIDSLLGINALLLFWWSLSRQGGPSVSDWWTHLACFPLFSSSRSFPLDSRPSPTEIFFLQPVSQTRELWLGLLPLFFFLSNPWDLELRPPQAGNYILPLPFPFPSRDGFFTPRLSPRLFVSFFIASRGFTLCVLFGVVDVWFYTVFLFPLFPPHLKPFFGASLFPSLLIFFLFSPLPSRSMFWRLLCCPISFPWTSNEIPTLRVCLLGGIPKTQTPFLLLLRTDFSSGDVHQLHSLFSKHKRANCVSSVHSSRVRPPVAFFSVGPFRFFFLLRLPALWRDLERFSP